MQTKAEELEANAKRLAAYWSKLNEDQRRRSLVAEQVSNTAKKLNLEWLQISAAIRLAVKKLESGLGVAEACEIGITTARIIAMTGANHRIPCIRTRWTDATN